MAELHLESPRADGVGGQDSGGPRGQAGEDHRPFHART